VGGGAFRLGQSRDAQDLDGADAYSGERRAAGRRRQASASRLATEVEAHDPDAMLRLPDASQWADLPQATVARRHSQWMDLLLDDGSGLRAALAGKLKGVKLVCGDRVHFAHSASGPPGASGAGGHAAATPAASVVAVLPRRSLLRRGGIDDREPWQLVCANADELWACAAVVDPPLRPGLLERAHAMALDAGVGFRIVVTKRDRASKGDTLPELDPIRGLGTPIAETSAKDGTGVDELKGLLEGRRVALVGHSGVGKSALINAVLPGAGLKTGETSKYGTGRQTTTSAVWLPAPRGGALIDTPGIRTLSVRGLPRELLPRVFPELPPGWLDDPFAMDPLDEGHGIEYPERVLSLRRLWEEMAARNPNQNVHRR
jgi:ribosome biogenesis GTPase